MGCGNNQCYQFKLHLLILQQFEEPHAVGNFENMYLWVTCSRNYLAFPLFALCLVT